LVTNLREHLGPVVMTAGVNQKGPQSTSPSATDSTALQPGQAADQGDPLGEVIVASMNILGQGRPVDHGEGVKWARLAAEQDCEKKFRIRPICGRAQGLLGFGYLGGLGVPQDYVLA
jgi:TPR repeat protein